MFSEEYANTFKIFSTSHLLSVFVVLFLVALVIIFRAKLREEKYFNFFRYMLVTITIGQEISINLWRIFMGRWDITTSLPFHLCGFGIMITSYLLITQNKKIFQSTYLILMIGAFMALVTPGILGGYGFPHYRFFQFFVSHGMIVINLVFMLFVMNYQEDFKYRHLLNNFLALLVFAVLGLVINVITGGNYLYLMAKPPGDTAFDLFGEHPWYLINIFFIGIPIFYHIFYIPFAIKDLIKRRKQITPQEA